MASIYDVAPDELLKKAAEELKKNNNVKPPEWASYAKTGMHKERPPADGDWWYIRCAAILRSVYKLGPIGVSKLRVKYGGKKNRGVKPGKFFKGSGSVIRKAMQQLETAKLVKKVEKEQHKGRIISPEGKSFMDKIAVSISKNRPKPVKKKAEVKLEKPKAEEKKEEKKETKPKSKETPKEAPKQ